MLVASPSDVWCVRVSSEMPDRENLAHIGYMTQLDGVYTDLSVWENLRFFAALSGTRDKAAMNEVLDLVELPER